jgi:hypothetical protein
MTVELGFAAIIKRNGSAIGKVKDVKPPDPSVDIVDVTTMDSASGYKEILPGMIDGGEVTVDMLFDADDTQQIGLYTDLAAKTLQTFTIEPESGAWTWTFTAYVVKLSQGVPMSDGIGLNANLKVSGVPVLATTASTGISALVIRNVADDGDCTAANYMPNWDIAKFTYGVTFTTELGFRIKATAASHTIKMYVDDVFLENLNSGISSSNVALSADSVKKVTLVAYESGAVPKTYTLMVCRIS